ncbi:TonB-dependent siderophore receptor [Pseudomonas aegrilactucae]|uniref:TonB-dependent siderophore receptor n=1 Tax=Pseudomonas aegrilactucae TaxID=2854028 RepID=A0A9Q3AG15_9PSED|nr:TonB-dependent siderophore receptor [Pseudomonas aegrilactucae]MBV6290190.1 TonB-dependent siderophore receptor [Pseudomonas aegrilactucae]
MPYLIRHTALSLAIVAASCVGVSQPASAADHQHAVEQVFDVAAGPLDQALTRFADQAGLRLMVVSEVVTRQQTEGLHGRYAVQQGLDRLLLGSGLSARLSGDVILVEKAPTLGAALELGTTTIQGQGMGQMTENSGSYTIGLASVGSKSPTSLRQTPQTVSVVTDQVIQERRMTSLTDAMKATPGITVKSANSNLSNFYSRGFIIENIQIDGAAPMALGTTAGSFYSYKNYDLVEFDHVEVLRGSSGLFGGTGDPGGMINLVRKRPLDTYQLKIDTSVGSWDNYRTQLDVTGPIAFDGRLRGRLVAAYTDRQYFLDDRSTEKPILYGVLEADITDSTMLTLGGRSERLHDNGIGTGVPRYINGDDLGLPRRNSLTTSWAYQDGRSDEVFAKIDHDFNDDWKVNVTYTQTRDSGLIKSSAVMGGADLVDKSGPFWYGSVNRYLSEQHLFDVNVAGKFEAFDRQHELLMGADYQKITSRWRGTRGLTGGGNVDVFDPGSTPWEEPYDDRYMRDYSPNTQEQYGLYSTLRLQLADPLHLIVGARAQRYKFEQVNSEKDVAGFDPNQWVPISDVSRREPTKVVPYGGLVFDLNKDWSTYISYSEIYKPQQLQAKGPLPGSPLEPMTGKTYELGLKGELWDGAVNTALSVYYTEQENRAVLDPTYPGSDILFAGSCCYAAEGKVVSKGFDAEVSGELLDGWDLMAAYTYNINKDRTNNSPFSTVTPKHSVKVWSTYQLQGALKDLKVGGGVNLQSADYVSGFAARLDNTMKPVLDGNGDVIYDAFDYRQAGYAVWNAMAEYQLDEHWALTYNLNNAFDKTYYATVGSSSRQNWYGEPRNHMLTLRGTFW